MNRHIALQLLLCSSMAQAAITPDQLFDWAEIQYYALFPGNSSTAQYEGYTYRYYPQSNNYLAVKDGDIWVLGTIASSPLKIAPVADYQCQVLPDMCVDNTTRSALTHAVTSFSQLFSQGHPSADQLTPLLADDFLHNDKQRSTHIADLIGDADTLGMQFANVQVQALSGDLATVSFDVLDALGTLQERVYGMQLRKINQQWLWLGNQQRFETGAWAQALRHSRNNAAATLSQGLEFSIIDADASNSSDISHAIITGPGLPVAGLTYVPGTGGAGNQWVTTFTQPGGTASITSPYYQINNDTTIQRIPNAAIYQMQFYRADASLAYTYQAHILQRPHLGAEALALTYPDFSPASQQAFASYLGGAIAISGTAPAGIKYVWAYLKLVGNAGTSQASGDYAISEQSFTATDLGTQISSMQTVTVRNSRISYRDSHYRSIMTEYYLGP